MYGHPGLTWLSVLPTWRSFLLNIDRLRRCQTFLRLVRQSSPLASQSQPRIFLACTNLKHPYLSRKTACWNPIFCQSHPLLYVQKYVGCSFSYSRRSQSISHQSHSSLEPYFSTSPHPIPVAISGSHLTYAPAGPRHPIVPSHHLYRPSVNGSASSKFAPPAPTRRASFYQTRPGFWTVLSSCAPNILIVGETLPGSGEIL